MKHYELNFRNILGTKNLHEILSDRESISGNMQVISLLVFTFLFFANVLYFYFIIIYFVCYIEALLAACHRN